jgi:hypothetical protein
MFVVKTSANTCEHVHGLVTSIWRSLFSESEAESGVTAVSKSIVMCNRYATISYLVSMPN